MARERDGEEGNKRRIVVNTDDPATGEYSFQYYHNTRPKSGHPDMDRARAALRGLRGKTIRVTAIGTRFNADDPDDKHRTRLRSTLTLDRYGDIFGRDGVLLSMLKHQVEDNSGDVYVLQYIDIEEL